jgi:hypothetical protein
MALTSVAIDAGIDLRNLNKNIKKGYKLNEIAKKNKRKRKEDGNIYEF